MILIINHKQVLSKSNLLFIIFSILGAYSFDKRDMFFFPFRDTTLVFFIFGSPEGYKSHEVMFY